MASDEKHPEVEPAPGLAAPVAARGAELPALFSDREETRPVVVTIDDRARRSQPPPAVELAPLVAVRAEEPAASPSAPTRAYDVVGAGETESPPPDLLAHVRRSDAPLPLVKRAAPLGSTVPTRVGLPRVDDPPSALPSDEPDALRGEAPPRTDDTDRSPAPTSTPALATRDAPRPARERRHIRGERVRRVLPRVGEGGSRGAGAVVRRTALALVALALAATALVLFAALVR